MSYISDVADGFNNILHTNNSDVVSAVGKKFGLTESDGVGWGGDCYFMIYEVDPDTRSMIGSYMRSLEAKGTPMYI